MAPKRGRDSVDTVGEADHPPHPSIRTLTSTDASLSAPPATPATPNSRPLPPSQHALPRAYSAAQNNPAPNTPTQTPSFTVPHVRQQPPPTPLPPNTEFSDALNTALSALAALPTSDPTDLDFPPSSGTAFHPLAHLILTHNTTTPQRTLAHYHTTTTPDFDTHLTRALDDLSAANPHAIAARTQEVMHYRREHERQMHAAAWAGWQAEQLERRWMAEEALRAEELRAEDARRAAGVRRRAEWLGRETARRNRERWVRNNSG